MSTLLEADTQLFFFFNHLPHTPFFDWVALFFSGVGSAGFIWVSIGFFLFLKEEIRDRRFFVPILFSIGTCWFFVEGVFKYMVGRLRPTVLDGTIIVGDGAGWFSFPSSHAAISWAMAVVLSRYEPRWRGFWYLLAGVISFTRVYLGVHYPSDVIAGAVLGWGIGKTALALGITRPHGTSAGRKRRSHSSRSTR